MMANPKDFFIENSQRFANPDTEPEKFNLYGGLTAICNQLSDIENRLRKIEHDINFIKIQRG